MQQTVHTHRFKFQDKWKILVLINDRKDFEGELLEVCNKFYDQGWEEGQKAAIAQMEKLNAAKELPFERGKG